jgi:hypothetical protein
MIAMHSTPAVAWHTGAGSAVRHGEYRPHALFCGLGCCSAGLNKKYVTAQLTAAAAASATAQETLAGIRTVKSFAKEQQIVNT